MSSKVFALLFVQLAIFNVTYSQTFNRVIPINEAMLQNILSLSPNVLTNVCPPNVVPVGPNIVPFGPNVVPISPNVVPIAPNVVPVAPNLPFAVDTILSSPMTAPTTTIIQDSTVANNLANALQLLVVSNLLSNTLPNMGDVVIPNYAAAPVEVVSPMVGGLNGLGGYSFVY